MGAACRDNGLNPLGLEGIEAIVLNEGGTCESAVQSSCFNPA